MRQIIIRLRQPLIIRHNHLFCYESNLPLDFPLHPLPEKMELIFPVLFKDLSPAMFDGGINEYNGLLERTRLGDQIGVIIENEKIVHRSVVQTRGTAAMEGDPKAMRLSDGEKYIHWCETVECCSGKGLYSAMLRAILQKSNTEPGFRKAYIACRQDNIGSVKGVLKAGFTYVKSSRATSVLGGFFRHSSWYRAPQPPQLIPGQGYAL